MWWYTHLLMLWRYYSLHSKVFWRLRITMMVPCVKQYICDMIPHSVNMANRNFSHFFQEWQPWELHCLNPLLVIGTLIFALISQILIPMD